MMNDSQLEKTLRILDELDIEIDDIEDIESIKCSLGHSRICPCDDPECVHPPGCNYHNPKK